MNKSRVLYIDDEEDLLDLAASFFEDEELPIDTCTNFNDALQLVKNNSYDLIISDAKMPSGSGLELLQIIKHELGFKGKMILVTGDLQKATDNTPVYDQVIYKPIEFQSLVKKVKEFLD